MNDFGYFCDGLDKLEPSKIIEIICSKLDQKIPKNTPTPPKPIFLVGGPKRDSEGSDIR